MKNSLFSLFWLLNLIPFNSFAMQKEMPNPADFFADYNKHQAVWQMAKDAPKFDLEKGADEVSESKLKAISLAGLGVAAGGAKLAQGAFMSGAKTFSQIDPVIIAKVTGSILVIFCGRLVYLKLKDFMGFYKDRKKSRKLKKAEAVIESIFGTDKSIKTTGLGLASVLDSAITKKIHILTQDQISMAQRIAALEDGHRLHQEHIEQLQSTIALHDRRLKALEIQKTSTTMR